MDLFLHLEPELVLFYTRLSAVCGISLQQILADALYRLAGELSLEAIASAQNNFKNTL